jgi:hypothetical protein
VTPLEAARKVLEILEEARLLCIEHNLSEVTKTKHETLTGKIIKAKRHAKKVIRYLETDG